MLRITLLILGYFFLILAGVGLLVPLIPATPFLLLSIACFSRSSPKMRAWLLSHPRVKFMVEDWNLRGAIPKVAKAMAVCMMSVSVATIWISTLHFGVQIFVTVLLLGLSGFILSRPS